MSCDVHHSISARYFPMIEQCSQVTLSRRAFACWIGSRQRRLINPQTPAHLRTGKRGEEDAYFYLRHRGYIMVARNYRTARHHGEIDLIGWDDDVLCFIEVKTRTTRDVKPAAAAVDRKKRHDLRIVIRDYLRSLPQRQFPEVPQWRFDVVTVYYEAQPSALSHKTSADVKPRALPPTFELFQNAALSS